MSREARYYIGGLTLAVLAGGGYELMQRGSYGLTLFILFPVLVGAVGSWFYQPKTGKRAAGVGALAVLCGLAAFLLIGIEGLICIAMAIPLMVPLGALGGWLAYKIRAKDVTTSGVLMLLMLPPASLTWDVNARPDLFEVTSRIEIAAPPERVWNNVISEAELAAPDEWFFRAGLAYPKKAWMEGQGVGAVRYCDFSTGPFVEPIEVWDEPHLLRFRVTENPAPMHEWSPYAKVLPKHLHGYFVSKRGQFKLTALPNGHTLLEGTSWYQHGLWPGEYWRWWSDAIIHQVHMRVFAHIRALAEGESE